MNEKVYLRASVDEKTGALDALFYLELKEDEEQHGVFVWWVTYRGFKPLNTLMRSRSLGEARGHLLRLWARVGWAVEFLE